MYILLLALVLCAASQEPSQEDIGKWVEGLGADYQEERLEAFNKLKAAGKKAEDALAAAVAHQDFRVRRACLELLTEIGSKKVVGEAARLFDEDPNESVQKRAFAYLIMCGTDAEDALVAALDRPEPEYRLAALRALAACKSQKCVEKVAGLYDTEPPGEIKSLAFQCLQQVGAAAKPYLLKLLKSGDPGVRDGALRGLQNIEADDDDAVNAVSDLFVKEDNEAVQIRAFEYLKGKKERAEPAFIEGLKSTVERVRLFSIEGLTLIESENALEAIADLFDTTNSDEIRQKSFGFLKAQGLKAEDRLLKSLENKNAKVRLLAIEGLGVIGSEKPLERISKLFREDLDAAVHRAAFSYVESLGRAAENDLVHALEDSDLEIRLRAIRALGRIRSEKAIQPLIGVLGGLNPALQDAACDALVRIGAPAVEKVRAAGEKGDLKKKIVDKIVTFFDLEEVERVLGRLVTGTGGTGYFEGQFKDLTEFGVERAVPILMKISAPQYRLRVPPEGSPGYGVSDYERSVRELALLALGELGDASVVPELVERLEEKETVLDDYERAAIVIAAHRLGEKEPFAAFIEGMKKRAEEDVKGEYKVFDRMFYVAMVQNRAGEREASLKTYGELKKIIEENRDQDVSNLYDEVLYNIACLHALAGRKDEAVKVLEAAVRAGFRDREWIKMDRDLEALREMNAFKDLLADDELFKEEE
ncbi:MAG: HEAT repeat domain-containing protein [Planctomycetota bacterium]|jgi:HEAT repeat protein